MLLSFLYRAFVSILDLLFLGRRSELVKTSSLLSYDISSRSCAVR